MHTRHKPSQLATRRPAAAIASVWSQNLRQIGSLGSWVLLKMSRAEGQNSVKHLRPFLRGHDAHIDLEPSFAFTV